MNQKDWESLLANSIENIKSLVKLKGGEYSGDNDRLENFKRNGRALDLPMETIWAVYYNKHHDAVMQYIQDLQNNKMRERGEPIAGRLDDMIVYCLLFKAMLQEGADRECAVNVSKQGMLLNTSQRDRLRER